MAIRPNNTYRQRTPEEEKQERLQTYQETFGDSRVFILIGSGLRTVDKFDTANGRFFTGQPDHTEIEIYIEGAGTGTLRLPVSFTLPKIDDMAEVKLTEPGAFLYKKNYRFEATDITKA